MNPMPAWLEEAYKYEGVKEFPGASSNPVIVNFWKLAKLSGIKNDHTPWCSGFACAMLEAAGVRSPRSDGAKNFLGWGHASPYRLGAVCVLKREGGYHVMFAVGETLDGRIVGIGGNQGDAVSVAAFSRNRIIGVRWPAGVPAGQILPIVSGWQNSTKED